MSDEEIDVLYNEILKLPKIERPITATTMCELNVNDLFDTIREFRKIPDYNELINDNRKKDKRIELLENRISKVITYIGSEEHYNDDFDTEIDKILDILGSDEECTKKNNG